MDATFIPAFAALAGSAIGGLTSFASAWLTQDRHDRTERFEQDKSRRQKLYNKFINEGAKLYADALSHNEAEVTALFSIYALIDQMQVLSSPSMIEEAQTVTRQIVDTYARPNKTFPELRNAMKSNPVFPLRTFAQKCRDELSNPRSPLAVGARSA